MKKFVKIFAAALIFGTAVSPAMADGFYGALDFGQTKAADACSSNPSSQAAGSTVTGCEDKATMYRIAAGYQFYPMWGAELSYGNYGKASQGTITIPATTMSEDYKLSGIQVSGTGTFHLGDAFALTGKIGIAQTDLKITGTCSCGIAINQSANSTKLAYGIGAQYAFTNSVAIRAQYENLGTVGDNTTGTSKVSLLSVGVVLKF